MNVITKRNIGRILMTLITASLWSSARAIAPADGNDNTGNLHGNVQIDVGGVRLRDVGPIVVFLERIDKENVFSTTEDPVRMSIQKISQLNANFNPDFVVTTVGQTLEFPNNDTITHNVFSYSKHNGFDLGLYPKGTSKSVRFDHPGVVRIYCSIHQSMNGLIFVAPTPYHAIVDSIGSFTIPDVPVGKYRLIAWNDRLPEVSLDIAVRPGDMDDVSLVIEE